MKNAKVYEIPPRNEGVMTIFTSGMFLVNKKNKNKCYHIFIVNKYELFESKFSFFEYFYIRKCLFTTFSFD